MRRLLSQANSPGEIVDIANHCGYAFTIQELRSASIDLAAPHWAWGGRSEAWKEKFFNQALADQSS